MGRKANLVKEERAEKGKSVVAIKLIGNGPLSISGDIKRNEREREKGAQSAVCDSIDFTAILFPG